MKSFGEYTKERNISFEVEGVEITLEPVPIQLFEKHIIGVDDDEHAGMVKYRVTFSYPHSQEKAKYKNYEPETRYILANSPQEAKERIIEYVRTKKRKKSGDQLIRRHQDYLFKFPLSDMRIRVKEVKSWNDFVELAAYIAKKRPKNPVQYFNSNDLSIFVNKAKTSKDFNWDLQQLPKGVQLLLKRIYFHIINGPMSPETQELMNTPDPYWGEDLPMHKRLGISAKGLGKTYPKPPSKDISEDPDPALSNNVREILQQAKMYGIKYKDLKMMKDQVEQEMVGADYEERLKAWRDVKGRLGKANLAHQKSHDPHYSGKGGVGYSKDMVNFEKQRPFRNLDQDEIIDKYAFLRPKDHEDPDRTYMTDFTDFYMNKPKKPESRKMWYTALERMLDYMRQQPKSEPEEVPF